MASRAALIRESDLRRMAKVAREENVSIRGTFDALGGFTVTIAANVQKTQDDGGDLDDRLAEFGGR